MGIAGTNREVMRKYRRFEENLEGQALRQTNFAVGKAGPKTIRKHFLAPFGALNGWGLSAFRQPDVAILSRIHADFLPILRENRAFFGHF